MDELAPKHAAVKFVRIRATTAVEAWPDSNLPAVYLYRDGEMKHQLVGSRQISAGPPPFNVASVERKLLELGVVDAAAVRERDADAPPPPPPEAARGPRRSAYAADDATWDKSGEGS